MALSKLDKVKKAVWSKEYLAKVLKDKQTIYTLTAHGKGYTNVVRIFIPRKYNNELIIDEITAQVAHVLGGNFVNDGKRYGIKVRGGGFDVVDDMNRAWTGKGFIHRELGM